MATITMEDIIESNRLKEEACDNCKEDLKDKLTPEQLQKFEDAFYSASKGYLFKRKENKEESYVCEKVADDTYIEVAV